MQIPEALQNLGLSSKEAVVYPALLKLGRGSAASVAGEAGLKRPTTYVILGELMRKGLVLKIPRTRKQLFAAKSPEEFFAEARERLELAETVLPQLVAISEKPEKRFKTLYFEGIKGLKEMYAIGTNRMHQKEIIGFFARIVPGGPGDELEEKVYRELTANRKDVGITVRGVTPDDTSLGWYRAHIKDLDYKIKFLDPKDYLADTSMEIGEDYVQVISHRYQQGVHIDNPDIANSMRQIFEMVWKSRKEPVVGKTEIAGT